MKILLIRGSSDIWEEENALYDILEECDFLYESDVKSAVRHKDSEVSAILLPYHQELTFRELRVKELRRAYPGAKIILLTGAAQKMPPQLIRAVDGILRKPIQKARARALLLNEWEDELLLEYLEEAKGLDISTGGIPEKIPAEGQKLRAAEAEKSEEPNRNKSRSWYILAPFAAALLCMLVYGGTRLSRYLDQKRVVSLQQELLLEREKHQTVSEPKQEETNQEETKQELQEPKEMLPQMKALYERNSDIIGWITIPGTVIDYPVMQTPEEEEYYIRRDFDKKKNRNGSLFADTDSIVGGDGSQQPSTNLLIYGHTMKSGEMFGKLQLYENQEYGEEHSEILFDSLYDNRKYQLIAVFYSHLYNQNDQVFKYYRFFQADNEEQFDQWIQFLRENALYDTGVEAEYGDEFITLSSCSEHVENGRFAVVGKRIQ